MKTIDSSDAFGLALIGQCPIRKNKDIQEIMESFKGGAAVRKIAERILDKAEKELKYAMKTKVVQKRITFKTLQIPKGYFSLGENGYILKNDLVAGIDSKHWLKVRYYNMPVSMFRSKKLTFIRKI